MSADVSLIDAVTAHVTPGMVTGISRDTGMSPFQAEGLVKRSVATVIAAMVSTAATAQGASRLLLASTEAAHQSGGGRSDDVGLVFGDRTSVAIDSVARTGRTTREVAARVISSIAPIALAILGNEAIARHLTPAGLKQFLAGERLSGASGAETVTVVATPPQRDAPSSPVPKAMHWGWAAAVVTLVIIMGIAWSVLNGHRTAMTRTPAPAPEPTSQTTTTGATTATTERPDWASYAVAFDSASTHLTRDGDDAVKKIADAMTANPNTRITLVGATSRATTVKKALVERGIEESRIEIGGTREGRPQNRRVEVVPLGP